jgi:hypothetical protein
MRFGFNNKQNCIDNINKMIGTYETAVAHTPADYRYFQKKSLQILKTMIYVAKKKKVLDKPYAPELEPIKQNTSTPTQPQPQPKNEKRKRKARATYP